MHRLGASSRKNAQPILARIDPSTNLKFMEELPKEPVSEINFMQGSLESFQELESCSSVDKEKSFFIWMKWHRMRDGSRAFHAELS